MGTEIFKKISPCRKLKKGFPVDEKFIRPREPCETNHLLPANFATPRNGARLPSGEPRPLRNPREVGPSRASAIRYAEEEDLAPEGSPRCTAVSAEDYNFQRQRRRILVSKPSHDALARAVTYTALETGVRAEARPIAHFSIYSPGIGFELDLSSAINFPDKS